MGERYDVAVAKEKRLEVAMQPLMKKRAGDDDRLKKDGKNKKDVKRKRKGDEDESDSDVDSEEEEAKKSNKIVKKKKKAAVVNEADLKNVEALKEEDEVQEGIVWSDSD